MRTQTTLIPLLMRSFRYKINSITNENVEIQNIRNLFQHKLNSYSRLAGCWKREWLFSPKKEGSFCFCDPGQSGAHHPFHQSLTYNDWDLYEWPFTFLCRLTLVSLYFSYGLSLFSFCSQIEFSFDFASQIDF